MVDINKLVESYYSDSLSWDGMLQLIEEQIDVLVPPQKRSKKIAEALTGAKARERVLRLPNVIPTEISVGQKPSSQDRKQFELWMSNIGMEGGSDDSAVRKKLQAITSFFERPKENLATATIPQTLSYLMFINQFVWMLKEFNASVAGFLWEPFLASLFGGKSRQVPTSEGDIADIRIQTSDRRDAPISLKILNEEGSVKGSFSDLVKHFADGGSEMRYVIVTKQQSGKEKAVSSATFWEFNITAENFFDWIGNVAYTEVIDKVVPRTFTLFSEKGTKGPFKNTGNSFQVKHAQINKNNKAAGRWFVLAKRVKGGTFVINPEIAEKTGLRNSEGPVREGVLEPNVKYEVDLAHFKRGGRGGATLQRGYEKIPGALETKDTKALWGGTEGLEKWSQLAAEVSNTQEFFALVHAEAPGSVDNKQFHIKPFHYKNLGVKLGVLKITTREVEKFFKEAAEKMNDDLILMFNSLASLTDNIGRFFLVDCGDGKQCTEKDARRRNEAGQEAIADAKELQRTVQSSVETEKD